VSRPTLAPRKRTRAQVEYLRKQAARRASDQRRFDQAARRLVTWARSA